MPIKGINTTVSEAKDNIANAINEGIKSGLGIIITSLIVESLLRELYSNIPDALKLEKEEYERQLEIEQNLTKYDSKNEEERIMNEIN